MAADCIGKTCGIVTDLKLKRVSRMAPCPYRRIPIEGWTNNPAPIFLHFQVNIRLLSAPPPAVQDPQQPDAAGRDNR